MRLARLSYKPQDILDGVIRFTTHIDCQQETHQYAFVKCYKSWYGMETPEDPEEFRLLQDDLEYAMKALDGFFFGASFTGKGPYQTVDLCVQNNIFEEGQPGYRVALPLLWGQARALGNGRTRIYIDTLNDGRPRTTYSIFRTLVHEMAHAVYSSFACNCKECDRVAGHPLVLGPRGHGRLWKEMAEHMRNEIQTWDYDLAGFWSNDNIQWHHTKYT